jgi:hypothetical protein
VAALHVIPPRSIVDFALVVKEKYYTYVINMEHAPSQHEVGGAFSFHPLPLPPLRAIGGLENLVI